MNESIEKRVFDEGPRKTQRISTLRIDIAHCFEAFAEPREGFGVFELLRINESTRETNLCLLLFLFILPFVKIDPFLRTELKRVQEMRNTVQIVVPYLRQTPPCNHTDIRPRNIMRVIVETLAFPEYTFRKSSGDTVII